MTTPDHGSADHDSTENAFADDAFTVADPIEDAPDDTRLSLFEGDEGMLTLEQRRCLVVVLKHQIITDDRDEWPVLVRDARLIRSRLNDLFLDLVIDRDRGVAYKVQIRSDASGYVPPLLRDTAYTREETVLLAHLRQRHLAERGSGHPHAHIDRDDCLAAVAQFRPATATDRSGDEKKAGAAVDALVKAGILVKADGDDRFLISPVIETLLPIDRLRVIQEWLAEQNRPENARRRRDETLPDEPDDALPDDDDDEEDAA